MKRLFAFLATKINPTRLQSAARLLFGNINWQPPAWFQAARAHAVANPKRSGIAAVATLLLLISAPLVWKFATADNENGIVAGILVPDLAEVTKDGLYPQPMTIEFSAPAAPLDQIGKPVTQGIEMNPPAAGNWTWVDDRHLVFEPKDDWQAGQRYRIKLSPKLFPDQVVLSRYRIECRTRPFSASIDDLKFYINPKDPKSRQITATLTFSHCVDAATLQKKLILDGQHLDDLLLNPGHEPAFRVELADFGRKAYLRSLPVRLPDKASYASLTLPKGLKPVAGQGLTDEVKKDLQIPDLYSFLRVEFSGCQIIPDSNGDPHQTLMIRTANGVKPSLLHKNLSLWLLPKDRPALDERGVITDYNWASPAEIDDAILAQSQKIDLKLNPSDQDFPQLHSATVDLPPDRYLYVRLEGGLEGLGGFLMKDRYANVLRVPQYPKEVRIMHKGSVLAQSGERKLSVVTRAVGRVECRLGRIPADQINHLVSQSDGNFENPFFRNYSFGEDNLTKVLYHTYEVDNASSKANYLTLDFKKLLEGGTGEARGLFFLEVCEQTDNEPTPHKLATPYPDPQPQESRWRDQRNNHSHFGDQRFILITDLGIVVKDNADGTHDLFVQSIQSGRPVAAATVQVLGKNGEPVAETVTDADGHASLPRVLDLKREKMPVAFVVKKDGDLSFLPFNRADRRLNFSRYDTGGLTLPDAKKLTAFLFTERGLYRPGDDVHLGLSVKSYDWSAKLKGVPVEFEITDPRNMAVHTERLQLNAEGFLALPYTPGETAATGSYCASLYLVRGGQRDEQLGSTTFRVEEFLPDRMKIKAKLSAGSGTGWVNPKDLKLAVHLQNLYGTPAAGRRIQGEINLNPSGYNFPSYPGYIFHDPDLKPDNPLHSYQEQLDETKTDDKGEALLDLNLTRFEQGVYLLNYVTRGFEPEGGRNVATGDTVLVSARNWLIGYKPDADLSYLRTNSKHNIRFIAVNPGLDLCAQDNLRLKLSEEQYISVLTQNPNGNYGYQSVLKESEVSDTALALPATGFDYALPTAKPGSYVARILDANGTCLSVARFTVAGDANLSRSLEKNAELNIKLSKNEYKPGESIQMSITAPYTGAGLITIERDKVYTHKWFQTSTTGSTQSITLPDNLEGNAYVNVVFVRSPDSKEIFTSPLSSAVVPFSIDREKRSTRIDLTLPEKIKPGSTLPITFKTDRPTHLVVYAVDEGILQVARYELPDPLGHFLEKRALQVSTSQILDEILPEYSIFKAVAAAGGDGGDDLLAANLNPFKRKSEKPVVFWSGILESTGKAQTLTYNVPDYFNGTLHVMAVAIGDEAAGAAEKKLTVQGPFVIQPNVPTFTAPGDEFEVTVSVANNLEGSGANARVQLDLAATEQVEVLEKPAVPAVVAEGHDSVFRYKLKAKSILGDADLVFTASAGKEQVHYSSHLSVRPASPYLTRIRSGSFSSAVKEVEKSRDLYPQYRKLEANLSLLPLGFTWGLQSYLEDYPHLCSEQLTSRAFPMLLMDEESGVTVPRAEREIAIARILNILRTRQNDQGAFGLWQPQQNLHFDFPSLYVMHFLTEAQEHNVDVPGDMFQRGLQHLEDMAGETPSNLQEMRHQAYAIYLLTRNQRVTTNYLNRLKDRLVSEKPAGWDNDLTAVYCAGSYALLHNNKDAAQLISGFKLREHPKTDFYDFYTNLGRDSQFLYVLSKQFPDRLKSVSTEDLLSVIQPIADGEYCTHSAAYAILGLKAYSQTLRANPDLKLVIAEKRADGSTHPLDLSQGLCPKAAFSPEAQSILFQTNGAPRAFYQVVEGGFDRNPPTQTLTQGLEVQREYRGRDNKVTDHATLGEELTVHVKLRSLQHDWIANVAVIDLLPGGFEVVEGSTRNQAKEGSQERTGADYTDVREDRVVIYGPAWNDATDFVYKIRATNRGVYQVPPVQAEAMYRRSLQGRGQGSTIKVGE